MQKLFIFIQVLLVLFQVFIAATTPVIHNHTLCVWIIGVLILIMTILSNQTKEY